MLTALISIAVIAQGAQAPAQGEKVSAASLIGKMYQYYHGADTLAGRIRWTQAVADRTLIIDTEVQFDRPGTRLYLRQIKKSNLDPEQRMITCDGNYFSYDPPSVIKPKSNEQVHRLVETCHPGKQNLTLGDVYTVGGASLIDRNFPLTVIINRREDLEFENKLMPSLAYQGTRQLGDETVHVVTGRWRQAPNVEPTGSFEMLITDEGQLRKYSRTENVIVQGPGGGTFQVMSVWDVAVEKNPKSIDQKLFTVIR